MIGIYIKIAAAVLVLAAIGTLLGVIHHKGYVAGQAEKVAYYEPILASARDAKDKAEAHAFEVETDSRTLKKQMEADHVAAAKAMADGVAALNARILDLLRQQRAASRPGSGGALPGAGGSSGVSVGGTEVDERDRRFASGVSNVAGNCKSDAESVAGWQEWYRRQQSLRQ